MPESDDYPGPTPPIVTTVPEGSTPFTATTVPYRDDPDLPVTGGDLTGIGVGLGLIVAGVILARKFRHEP